MIASSSAATTLLGTFVESKVYDNVGREEVEVGIELAKEVLKGVYQMSDLLARLRGLKAKQEPSE